MRSISFRSLLIAAAVGFFALGLATTVLRPGERTPSATPSPRPPASPGVPSLGASQVTTLILGVEAAGAEEPTLVAAWLAAFRPPEKDVFLFGFRVDQPLSEGLTLADAFHEAGAPSEAFLEAFASLTPLPVDAVVVLDAAGFAAVIDFVGGVPTDGSPVGGEAAVEILELLHGDPQASLLAQSRLLQALIVRADRIQPGTDLQPLLGLVPDHATVRPSPQAALTLIAPWLPLSPDRIHLTLYDPDPTAP